MSLSHVWQPTKPCDISTTCRINHMFGLFESRTLRLRSSERESTV